MGVRAPQMAITAVSHELERRRAFLPVDGECRLDRMADRLLVPIANPETADRLLDTAVDLAHDRDLELVVLSVVTVPMQLSLEHARDTLDIEDEEALLADVVERARGYGVEATGRIRFGRDIADGICHVAAELDAVAVLVGWRGRPRRRDVVLGSHIDTVLANAPCDVLVKRIDRTVTDIESILVPVAGGPNTEFAAETAGALARAYDARVELLTVVPTRDDEQLTDARGMLTETSPSLGVVDSVTETVLEGDVTETILEQATAHDAVVIGAAENGLLRSVLVGDVPETVGREAESAVIMAKRYQGVSKTVWRRVRDQLR
ncbi:universal stress protein UspA [Natrialba sp. SSL1]|nr:universal stress protein UspA [Natrialba sp. SSL1]